MQRETIHIEIATITEKIILLNQQFAKTGNLMNAEIDLMNAYIAELSKMANQLLSSKAENVVINKPIEPVVFEPAKKNDIEAKPEPTSDETIITQLINTIPPEVAETIEDVKQTMPIDEEPIIQFVNEMPLKTKEATEESKPDSNKLSKTTINEKFITQKTALFEKLQVNNKSLKESISISEKMLFINNLFSKNAVLYESTLNQINELQNLDEATAILYSFNWDSKAEATQVFYKLLEKRFNDK